MSAAHAYQYVVLRCVPRVDREEFLNVGVVLYAENAGFLQVAWSIDEARMRAFAPALDCVELDAGLRFVGEVCAGSAGAGDAAAGSLGTRFGFLKAPRSTVLQPGPVHGGITSDPAATLAVLAERLVG
ncbi:MAG: DUF3037 domain-containing protein [Nocardioides sp.]